MEFLDSKIRICKIIFLRLNSRIQTCNSPEKKCHKRGSKNKWGVWILKSEYEKWCFLLHVKILKNLLIMVQLWLKSWLIYPLSKWQETTFWILKSKNSGAFFKNLRGMVGPGPPLRISPNYNSNVEGCRGRKSLIRNSRFVVDHMFLLNYSTS